MLDAATLTATAAFCRTHRSLPKPASALKLALGRSFPLIRSLFLTLVVAGCSDRPTSPTPQPVPDLSSVLPTSEIRRPQEEPFVEISKTVPGFGGYFLEGGKLVGYTTDLAQAPAARAALDAVAQKRRSAVGEATSTAPVPEIRQASYSFVQLSAWRDALFGQLVRSDLIIFDDLNEARNLIEIGLKSESGRPASIEIVRQLGIPPNAVEMRVSGRVSSTTDSLRTYKRPLQGGLQIAYHDTAWWTCSFGFNAYRHNAYGGSYGFVTNSHCSSSLFADDNTIFYQPDTLSVHRIGVSQFDPMPQPGCSGNCRYSDALAAAYDTTNFTLGLIARPTNRVLGAGGIGSVAIDGSLPNLNIVGKSPYSTQGDLVDKVGRTTGWTYGGVATTCVDIQGDDGGWPAHRRTPAGTASLRSRVFPAAAVPPGACRRAYSPLER